MGAALFLAFLNILAILIPLWVEHSKETPEDRDKDIDDAVAGSNKQLGYRLHQLADKLRRRKGNPRQ